ncbi:hypothetical protein PMI42_00899 [Bradyrhizobium sp. YR681]|uniref:hypothetical protein n=1 Tax=Bradyrhizobium sp. YR681 TaxID=1144344 RepID=UPI00027104CC|nr:hypothetical protein [Bradyrhizobium sp. YR681]EJN15524.1 hypothetical protein PMI42_00899 [Bradyrhizobium sp. YR681]
MGQKRSIGLRKWGDDGIQSSRQPSQSDGRVVDMQVGLLNGPPKHDLQGVVQRINLPTAMF